MGLFDTLSGEGPRFWFQSWEYSKVVIVWYGPFEAGNASGGRELIDS